MKSKSKPPQSAIAELRANLDQLIEQTTSATLSTPRRRALEKEIRSVIEELGSFLNTLDPIRQPSAVFDPSNPKVVGRFVSLALVAQQRHPLSEIPRFYGSGIYAIYYKGSFPPYAPISGSETPIYVGQAAPAVNNARTPLEQGARLCMRLSDHRKNIGTATTTLDLTDFEFRSLVVQSGWETAAEDYMIHLFRPIWNSETNILYGLGKHGDDAKTRANKRSPWDTMHPGRKWAEASKEDARSPDTIKTDLARHFQEHPIFPDLEHVLTSFLDELRQV
ncbi:Restriction endonuclease, type II, Eco29kI [Sphingobium chlorophenolicum L-1]|uniref:Restriction endonuclease, type II, Eco29kI n=1 Tax=Sphingobium chlorophenolicum L-1 TaxID=690566 RepID=F6EVA4_SPHCR|nr:Eco29kI family restriction endonuclease [Sphingobium chlorophenolicum]AEG49665.1 Restriction endonuclease, type II, Eco29kI [Sphingobium chlorophenolicum L-1]